MANTSFESAFQIRNKYFEELTDGELGERAMLDIVKEINKQRKLSGGVTLTIDENCMKAAEDSFQNIGNLQSLATSHSVVGYDFFQVFQEKQMNLTSSLTQKQTIYDAYMQVLMTLDAKNKGHVMDNSFTHIGLAAKRTFSSFKIMIILFKKHIQISHVNFDLTTGILIQGKVIDPYFSIFVVVVKDGSENSKPALAGPKRISVKSDLREFEISIPRLLLSQRSVNEKVLEFYALKADPRSIGYSTGQDITSLPAEAVLCHKMAFTGIWYCNIKFEEGSSSELQFIREEYEAKNGSKIISHSSSDFRSRGRGRGTVNPSISNSNNSTGRGEWNNRGTPWKTAVTSRLSTITEAPAEIKKDLWARDATNKENNPFAVRETFAQTREHSFVQPSPSSFPANNFPGQNFSSSSPFTSQQGYPANPFQEVRTSGQGFQPNPSFQTTSPMYSVPGYQASGPMFTNPPMFNQSGPMMNMGNQPSPMLSQPNPMLNHSNPMLSQNNPMLQQSHPMYNQPQFPNTFYNPTMNYSNPMHPYPVAANFTMPSISNQFNSAINPYLANFPPPERNTMEKPIQMDLVSPRISDITPTRSFYPINNEEPLTKTGTFGVSKMKTDSNPAKLLEKLNTEIDIPCLPIPIPTSLLGEVRKPRPENTSYTKLYSTMEYSDIILRVKDSDFKSHKAVLFSASAFFRDQLEKNKTFSSVNSAKLFLPNYFSIEAFKLVLKFMYTCDLDKEAISLSVAKDMLIISDYLQVADLSEIIIVKYILTQVTREKVIEILALAYARVNKEVTEGWEYLIESCALFAGQHSNWLVRNQRAECMNLPLSCVMKIADYSMRFITANDQISLVIKLLTDMRYAECVFDTTIKITELYLSGYNGYPVDVRVLDFVKPLTSQQISKLDEKSTMQYPLLDEETPWFSTNSRSNPVPPQKISENINQTFQSGKNTFIVHPNELVARGKPVFSFTVSDALRPKNVMSACFTTATRKWSILFSTSKDLHVSLYLCERGPVEKESSFTELLFTSVLFEIEIEDIGVTEALRTGNQPGYCAGFFSFANNHYQMAGERNFCKSSALRASENVKINVFLKEINLHSGLLHYLCENFDTLMSKSPKKFTDLCCFNLKYLLSHDLLPVAEEHEAAGALWKYAANKLADFINLLVAEIRFQFLSTQDILTLARDHVAIRSTANFKYIFKLEYFRRIEGKEITAKPRKKYENRVGEMNKSDYNEEIIEWILCSRHHQGYEERIAELKKRLDDEKSENNKRRAELNAKKHEMTLEYEKINREMRMAKGYDPEPKPELAPFYQQGSKCQPF